MLEPIKPPNLDRHEAGGAEAAAADALRLLVIDDDDLHRLIICRAAAKAGFVPVAAASYSEAEKLTLEAAFDCISLDLSLGEHAGVEMVRHLSGIGCKAPIIIISGCDGAICRETAKVAKSLNLQVWETLSKPVDLAVLRYLLDKLKAKRR